MDKFEKVTRVIPLLRHDIILENPTPIKQRYRHRNPAMQHITDTEVEKMLEEHVIRPLGSSWSSPIVLAKKKDGKSCFCVDFRKWNLRRLQEMELPQVNYTT